MAAQRVVRVRIHKAEDLNDVNILWPLKTYAVVDVGPYGQYTTQVDEVHGLNPIWDETFGFILPESALQPARSAATMKVDIYTISTLGTKHVGEVTVPLPDVRIYQSRKYPVRTSSGEFHGKLHSLFQLGELVFLGGEGQHPPIMTRVGAPEKLPTRLRYDHIASPRPDQAPAYPPVKPTVSGAPKPTTTTSKQAYLLPASSTPSVPYFPPAYAAAPQAVERPQSPAYTPTQASNGVANKSYLAGKASRPSSSQATCPMGAGRLSSPHFSRPANTIPLGASSINGLFDSPLGKVLLSDVETNVRSGATLSRIN